MSNVRGLDSSQPPLGVNLTAAFAYGIRVWAGYFAGQNILNGWALEDFQRVHAAGFASIAFCSGWADPEAMRTQGSAWGVPICLDVEGLIRPDGPWVQPWLDAAQAGLYGNMLVHVARRAAFHVLADYTDQDPGESWPSDMPRPADGSPCGWQWQGTHQAFGMAVDSAWYDDAFYGGGGGLILRKETSMILVEANGTAYITDFIYKRLLDASGLVIWSALGVPKHENIDPGFIASIPEAPTSGGTEAEPTKVAGTFTGTIS